ncbi:MAG: polysaccharide biosynthesis C-terminal domain-containing protein, partial [Methanophagales archaeon]|nr:polysaccharide biosynthesis C-terminal domain-containing protein [Methanophagales archaeon]
ATDVGHYAVAVGLSRFFWIVPQAVQTITYPTTSEYWTKNNHAALQKMIDKSMKNTACVLLPIGLGVGFFARDIITFIFGEEFIYAVLPLQILLIGTSINGSTSRAIGGSLSAVGRPDLDLKKVSISALSNIILNILLIPYFGIVGAAIATAVSLSITSALGMFLIIKTVQIKIDFKWYTKTLLVTLLFIFIYMCFGCTYLLSFTFVVAYVFTIIIFLVGREEKEMFKRLLFNLKSKFE